MKTEQIIEPVHKDALLVRVREIRRDGYRPVQISATRFPETVELTYSFDRGGALLSLRLSLPGIDARVPSISSIFAGMVLYENELFDLFNVRVDDLAIDFKGNLYKTAVKFPFGSTKPVICKPGAKPETTVAAKSSTPAAPSAC